MPSFNFSISNKKSRNKKPFKDVIKDSVILRNTKGVVWIDENAIYSVSINQDDIKGKYLINKSCYSCKGHARIYRQGVPFKDRFIYIRNIGEYVEQNINEYLPFDPGCVVVGDLIHNAIDDIDYFTIKNCFVEKDNDEAISARLFYKEHIDKINKIINIHKVNGL